MVVWLRTVPHLCLPMVCADLCMASELFANDREHCPNSVWTADHCDVVEVNQQLLPINESALDGWPPKRDVPPNLGERHDRSGRLDKNRDHELKRGLIGRRSSNARQLGCVVQDMTPPKSILRKSSDMQRPIQRVKFKKAIARHTKTRDQNPSLGYICPVGAHERSPNAPKFEDRSQEDTEWQELGAREAAWKLAKSVFKSKEHETAAFFSSPENRCLPASTLEPEEREFVVNSGASMHMISKKDLSEAEMDTLMIECSPATSKRPMERCRSKPTLAKPTLAKPTLDN